MHRIDGAGHVNGRFVAEDPATLRPPTEITPEIMNAFQEELATLIEWAGIALDKGDNSQLREALVAKFAAKNHAHSNYQPMAENLTAIAALYGDANKMAYATGAGAWALADITAFGRTLLANADAAAMRSTLGAAPLNDGFLFINAANGLIKLPGFLGGFILQWGNATAGSNPYVDVLFPAPFPNTVYSVIPSYQSGSAFAVGSVSQKTNSGFRITTFSDSFSIPKSGNSMSWFAFGY